MPRISSIICLALSLFVTFFVLAPWFTEQILVYQLEHKWDGTMLFATGLVVVFIALFVAGIGSEPYWSKRQGIVGLAAVVAWLVGVQVSFMEFVEPLFARSSQALVFGICSVWLPVMAWSTFWPMPWSTRSVLVGVLILSQPVFPAIYRVGSRSEQDRFIVLRRNQSYEDRLATPTKTDERPETPTSPATESASETLAAVPAPPVKYWTVQNHKGASTNISVGSTPTAVSVTIDSLGQGNKGWEVQVICPGLQLKEKMPFVVNFRAKADKPRRLGVGIAQNYSPWKNLGLYQSIEVGTEWKDYRFVLASPESDEGRARLHFEAGEDVTAFQIDRVEISPPVAPLPEVSVAQAVPPSPSAEQPPTKVDQAEARPLPAPSNAEGAGELDLSQWTLVCSSGAHVSANVHQRVLSLSLADGNAEESYKVRLENRQHTLELGKEYIFRLRARSSSPRWIELSTTEPNPPHKNMGMFERIELTPGWKDFEFKFKASMTGPCWLHFNLNGPTTSLEITRAALTTP